MKAKLSARETEIRENKKLSKPAELTVSGNLYTGSESLDKLLSYSRRMIKITQHKVKKDKVVN